MERWKAAFRFRGLAAIALAGLVAAACSSSATPAPASSAAASAASEDSPVIVPIPTIQASSDVAGATDTAGPSSDVSEPTGVATSLDPCQLVTAQEASTLAGATFGAGVESTTSGHGKICTYGGRTLNVFMVIVGQAPDAATAKAEEAQAEGQLKAQAPKGVTYTLLPNLADGGAMISDTISMSGQSVGASAIYVLKGATFFGFSNIAIGKAPIPGAALQAEAQIILGRIP
jgi:hypothetical protein